LLASQDNPEAFVSEWRQAILLTAVAPSIGAPSRALAVCLRPALATRPAADPRTARGFADGAAIEGVRPRGIVGACVDIHPHVSD